MADTYNMDITSSNSVLTLTVEELFPSGIQLQNFSVDSMFAADALDLAETRMGIDGKIAAGYTPNIKAVTITLEASSPSYPSLQQIAAAMQTNRKIYPATLTARIESIGKRITWSKGTLKSGSIVPNAKKVLDPTEWVFHFETVEVSSI